MTSLTNQAGLSAFARAALDGLASNVVDVPLTLALTERTETGVRIVTVGWTAHVANLGGQYCPVAAGTLDLNSADVAVPTTHYVYTRLVSGAATMVVSTTDPRTLALDFAFVAIIRFQSVAGTATIFYMRRAYCAVSELLYNAANWDMLRLPTYLDGGALTINAVSGVVDMAALTYRRLRFTGTIDAITAGVLLLSDETTTHANLETVTTYLDGSAITAGKYHKVLLGAITSPDAAYPFVLIRQDKPSVEYVTLNDAVVDSERVAAVAFPLAYRGMVVPVAYIAMLKGDASDLEVVDLRATGITGSGGGGGGVADHSLLANLAADDHLQYLLTAGTRALTGDQNMGGFALTNYAAQAANALYAGPTVGAATAPTFRALVAADIQTALNALQAYGDIYVTGGAVAQALAAGVATKLTAFAVNGPSLNTTASHAADSITVTNAGVYRVTGDFTFNTSTNNIDVNFFAAVGGVTSVVGCTVRRLTAVANCSFNGLLALGAGAVVTVLVTASGATNLTVTEAHLTVERC